jgi:negative regulator of flagellin synthesis FlgM
MRINPFSSTAGQIDSEQSAQQIGTRNASKSAPLGAEDRTTLSSDSTSIGSLVGTALNSPAVRQDKVDSLRQAISSGQYELDPAKIAASMVDENA